MTVIGGLGTVAGPIIGSVFLVSVQQTLALPSVVESLRSALGAYFPQVSNVGPPISYIVIGIILVVIVIFAPKGLISLFPKSLQIPQHRKQTKRRQNKMKGTDHFAEALGIKVLEAKDGYCKVSMKVEKTPHQRLRLHAWRRHLFAGRLRFCACLQLWRQRGSCVQVSINFLKPSVEGDILTAEATRASDGKTMGLYQCYSTQRRQTNCVLHRFSLQKVGYKQVGTMAVKNRLSQQYFYVRLIALESRAGVAEWFRR